MVQRQIVRETVTALAFELSASGRGAIGGARLGASPGNFSHIQLFNPTGSGVDLIIERISVTSGAAAAPAELRIFNTALTNNTGNVSNKLIGGPVPNGEVRSQNNASTLGTLITFFGADQDGISEVLTGELPIILGSDEGILVVPDAANQGITCKFEWVEQ